MAPQTIKQTPAPPEPNHTHEQIAALAYHLWESRGCPIGTPEQDWLDAEKDLAAKQAEFDSGKRA